tara:strand:+ start:4280 stop:4510 length:231 start_codon:yes stop_codon:yes gene_type:complete
MAFSYFDKRRNTDSDNVVKIIRWISKNNSPSGESWVDPVMHWRISVFADLDRVATCGSPILHLRVDRILRHEVPSC